MTDRPIMFSAPMILGLDREATEQGTGKTMTRRLAWGKHIGVDIDEEAARDMRCDGWKVSGPDDTEHRIAWPATPWQRVQVGDRLWVRENFWQWGYWEPKGKKGSYTFKAIAREKGVTSLFHAAGYPHGGASFVPNGRFGQREPAWHLRPNIFLLRVASRFTLVVTGTKIERLQDITESDAKAEGVERGSFGNLGDETFILGFRRIWMTLHGTTAWQDNPEVVALTFTVHKQNIDALQVAA